MHKVGAFHGAATPERANNDLDRMPAKAGKMSLFIWNQWIIKIKRPQTRAGIFAPLWGIVPQGGAMTC
jgi:hypothetical protein